MSETTNNLIKNIINDLTFTKNYDKISETTSITCDFPTWFIEEYNEDTVLTITKMMKPIIEDEINKMINNMKKNST